MTDTDKLEQYIQNTFSKITDDEGRPLDVTVALPLLKQVLTGYTQEITEKKFDYIGESAAQFAINLILAQHYSKYDNRVLSLLAKKLRAPLQLYKLVGKQIAIKEHVRSVYLKDTMDMIMGILYHFYGIIAIKKFIEEALIIVVNHELDINTSPKKIVSPENTNDNPVKLLHEMIQSGGGLLDTSASETPEKKWQVKIIAKFNEKSLLFSHTRISGSKQKAKTEASRDILTFFIKNPDMYQQLQIPGEGNTEIHVLPISENDYCHLFFENTTHTTDSTKTNDWSNDPNSLHILQDDHEETALLLENLLLDNKMDVDTDPRQVKRQRQSIYPDMRQSEMSGTIPVKEESIDGASILETTQGSPSYNDAPSNQYQSSNSMESNVTYIKDEETFQPFNQAAAIPVDEAAAIREEKILKYFRKLFAAHRLVLLQCRTTPGQSKTVFLSFVVQHQDEMRVDITIQQGGDSHTPMFHAEVVLRSKTKNNVFIKTEGHGRRKKDAEQQAFNKMIEIVTNWNAML